MKNWVARFNPAQMEAETVLKLAVGRDTLLEQVLGDIRARIEQPHPDRHLLLTGPRGAGKSFFMRLLEIRCQRQFAEQASFVLLPEEQPNLFSITNLVANILERLGDRDVAGLTSAWQEDGEEAAQAIRRLLARWRELRPEAKLLVVGVENFDAVLTAAFPAKQQESFLRKTLQDEPELMLIATAVEDSFDNDSGQRLFRNFAHLKLSAWSPDDHAHYLEIRAALAERTVSGRLRNKIRAYAHFTGGNPRIGAALAELLLEQSDAHGAAVNLQTLVDDLTDYYRNLWERIPGNSRKLLDALIRNGEPCSQSALAARVQAQQSQIARAFQWLRDMGTVREIEEETRGRDKLYRVGDRLFVQFYRLRYIHPDAATPLVAMSDFLAELYDLHEKVDVARKLLGDGHREDARLMMRLGLRDYGIRDERLGLEVCEPERLAVLHHLLALDYEWDSSAFSKEILSRCKDDASLKQAYDDVMAALAACDPFPGEMAGSELAEMIQASPLYPLPNQMGIAQILTKSHNTMVWQGMKRLLVEFEEVFTAMSDEHQLSLQRQREQLRRDQVFPYMPFVAQSFWLALAEEDGERLASELFGVLSSSLQQDHGAQLGKLMRERNEVPSTNTVKHRPARYQGAVKFWRLIGNEMEVAWNLCRCAAIFVNLSRYEEALTAYLEALPLSWPQELQQEAALNLDQIGWKLEEQSRFEEALAAYLAALALNRQLENRPDVVWNLEHIGWVLIDLSRFQEALSVYQEALAINRDQSSGANVAWNLGQMARCHLHLGQQEAAWALLDAETWQDPEHAYEALQQLGDAVSDLARRDRAEAFALAVALLQGIAERAGRYDTDKALRVLFVDFLEMRMPVELVRDVLEEARALFGEKCAATVRILEAVLDYRQRGEDREDWLARQDPDLAITVRAILKESGLDQVAA